MWPEFDGIIHSSCPHFSYFTRLQYHKPTEEHWACLEEVARVLGGTPGAVVKFRLMADPYFDETIKANLKAMSDEELEAWSLEREKAMVLVAEAKEAEEEAIAEVAATKAAIEAAIKAAAKAAAEEAAEETAKEFTMRKRRGISLTQVGTYGVIFRVGVGGLPITIGTFATVQEAARAYDVAWMTSWQGFQSKWDSRPNKVDGDAPLTEEEVNEMRALIARKFARKVAKSKSGGGAGEDSPASVDSDALGAAAWASVASAARAT